jgi:arylsulfatase A-like enzyme
LGVAELDTQNIDPVAESGVRYANVHTTALCSSTRSYILTGRNHHSNGMARIRGLATGYPGYDGRMPFENGMLPEMLRPNGYNAFCLGKWHLSPSEDNTAAGPFHRWSLGRGFERFYGSAAPTAYPIRIKVRRGGTHSAEGRPDLRGRGHEAAGRDALQRRGSPAGRRELVENQSRRARRRSLRRR